MSHFFDKYPLFMSRSLTMINLAHNLLSEIKYLESSLLTQLDESSFFLQLGDFIKKQIDAQLFSVGLIYENSNIKHIIRNGEHLKDQEVTQVIGIDSFVLRTKKAYYSNNVSSDPLFCNEDRTRIKSSLCIPVVIEGVAIAIINFQNTEEKYFKREDITQILSILNELIRPISNIKMYLQAKQLNELLLKQIEMKEKEIEFQRNGLLVTSGNQVEEREILGISEATSRLKNIADKLASVESNCIIQGEPGVGKELLARRIHCRSQRKMDNYLIVDCSAMSEREMDVELFGEELIGVCVKKGLLELTKNGTLLIKNINFLTEKLQAKLYQAINSKKAQKIGGEVFYSINPRIMATSTVNMQDEVDGGHFREDLFYSIGKIIVVMPSLREHVEDIEVLANNFLNDGQTVAEQKILSPGAVALLKSYKWPGNVRELKNLMERSYIMAEGLIVEKIHLMDRLITKIEDSEETLQIDEEKYVEMTLEDLEQKHIIKTLEVLSGNKTKTAKILGITVKTLYNKLHNYGLIEDKEMI